ncbi:hypothetical protein [Enterobacter cloacae complex sp. 418I7]|uniref:hypothetical protein n=1 Tax=Enterobacter cloacae complex sp. 418I7 TaxID=3395839 RepID=UPI003CF7C9FB
MLNDKRYNVDRFGEHDKIYYGNKERAYTIEPDSMEKKKYDVFSDFLASFVYKHAYKDGLNGMSQQAKNYVFEKDFEKLMNVYEAVSDIRLKHNMKSLGVSTYLNNIKANGVEISVSEELRDKIEQGIYLKNKGKEISSNIDFDDGISIRKNTVKL